MRNDGEFPLEVGWGMRGAAPRRVVIEPGQERVVPMDAVINMTGDPRSGEEPQVVKVDEDMVTIPSRRDERLRLRARYACFAGSEDEIKNDQTDEHHPRPIPQVSVFISGETGEREQITTVLDDPLGEKTEIGSYSSPGQEDLVEAVIRQQRQINLMAEQLRQAGAKVDLPAAGAATSEAELPSDDPDTEPKPKPKAVKKVAGQIKTPITPQVGVPIE